MATDPFSLVRTSCFVLAPILALACGNDPPAPEDRLERRGLDLESEWKATRAE
jgi:hypothetical protein